jgi:hypothetical protein
MKRSSQIAASAAILLTLLATIAPARLWTDATGQYTVDADLVAFNDNTVVLQRKDDKELGAVPIEKLSQADREFLQSKEAAEAAGKLAGGVQTWKLSDGTNILGRVVIYARKDITLQRRRGRIYVNDRVFENLPEMYQLMLPKIVARFERINQPDRSGLESWLVRQRGAPRTFTIDGVIMELENGDEYVVPFFFFSNEDLQVLQPGWEKWLAANQGKKYDEQENQAFLLQSAAAARQADEQVKRQIALMQLNLQAAQAQLQAVQAGVLSLWEVTLYPARGTAGPPLWVVVPGRTSIDATNQALSQHAGYVAGPVRRVNRF